jgi:hypothetical protein
MGQVAEGDELTSMQIWVWQVDGGKVRAAAGKGNAHPGKHPLAAKEELPFVTERGWMVQTELEPGSEQFSEGKPALAMAMAIVKHADGSTDVDQWNQSVLVKGRRHHEYPEDEGGYPQP